MNVLLSLSEHLADRHQWYTAPPAVRAFHGRLAEAPWHDLELKSSSLAALCAAASQTDQTGQFDEKRWVTRLAEQTIRQALPRALRAAADLHPDAVDRAALRAAADRCCREGSEAAAWAAAVTAQVAAVTAQVAAGARAAAWAADAAWAAADAAWAAADAAAGAAASAAAAAAAAQAAEHDQILCLSVKIAIEALP